jgi:hypothetical protein
MGTIQNAARQRKKACYLTSNLRGELKRAGVLASGEAGLNRRKRDKAAARFWNGGLEKTMCSA